MERIFGLAVLLSLIIAFSHGELIELGNHNFTDNVRNGQWLVEFYAPWCGFCKNFAPEYEKIAEKLEGKIKVAKVNVDAEKGLGARYNIRSLPTIKYFNGLSEEVLYEGSRTIDDIVKFVEEKQHEALKPPPTIELTKENLWTFVKPEETWLLKFYTEWCSFSKKLAPVWDKLAKELHPQGIRIGNVNIGEDEAIPVSQLFQITPYGAGYPIPHIVMAKGGVLYLLEKEGSYNNVKSFALGGYKNSRMDMFPPKPNSSFLEQAKAALPLLEAYAQRYPLQVFGGVFLYGLFIGYLISDKKQKLSTPAKAEKKEKENTPKSETKNKKQENNKKKQ